MKNENLKSLFKEYKKFLTETSHSINTADQYCTYLRKACIFINLGEGFLEAIVAISDSSVKTALCEYIMAKLSNELEKSDDKSTKKHISNYKSAVAMFSEFVSQDEPAEVANVTTATYLPEITLPCESVYDQKALVKKFKARLITQDRYYYGDNSCFPTRIISRIATKIKRKDLYEKLILDTKFLYGADENKVFHLRDITKLTIKTDGHVKIEVKGKEYDVFTEVWENGSFISYELLRVTSVKYISLDHMISIHSELIPFLNTHSEFQKFSNDVIKCRNNFRDMNISDFSSNYFETFYQELSVDEKRLIDEISEFINKLELLILHKSFNSSKNDSI